MSMPPGPQDPSAYGATPPPGGGYDAPPPGGGYGTPPPGGGYGGPPAPPSYGGGYGVGGGTEKNGLGTWALVLGILSIVCFGFLAGIPAVILGRKSKEAGAAGQATNANLGNIGMILGIVGIALSVIGLIVGLATGFNYATFGNTTS